MNRSDNPYASPNTRLELIPTCEPRPLGIAFSAVVGVAAGTFVFFAALLLTPTESTGIAQFDKHLSQRVGILLPIVVGFWVAWVRQSRLWAFAGPIVGIGLGLIYWFLVTADVSVAIFFLPILLGSIAAFFLGL